MNSESSLPVFKVLCTDFYQLSMVLTQAWAGKGLERAGFEVFYRNVNPHLADVAGKCTSYVFAGGARVLEYVRDGIAELKRDRLGFVNVFVNLMRPKITACGGDWEKVEKKLREFFEEALKDEQLDRFEVCVVDEGTCLHAYVPAIQVNGPLWLGQLLETPITCLVNGATGLATLERGGCEVELLRELRVLVTGKGDDNVFRVYTEGIRKCAREFVRMCGDKGVVLLEAGYRRAPGMRSGLLCSRVAVEEGFSGTSHVGAHVLPEIQGEGKRVDVEKIGGTMAHAWVMSFENEIDAFREWWDVWGVKGTCFVVDTYDVDGAMESLFANDLKPFCVRIDSAPLAAYARSVRKALDHHRWDDVKVYVSGDVSVDMLEEFEREGVPYDLTMVGSKMVNGGVGRRVNTGFVYKLVEICLGCNGYQCRGKVHYPMKKAFGKGNQPGLKRLSYDRARDMLTVDCKSPRVTQNDGTCRTKVKFGVDGCDGLSYVSARTDVDFINTH